MSSKRMSCLLLSLLLCFLTDVNSEVEVDLVLNGYWKPVHTEENKSPVPIKVQRQYTTGMKTHMSEENVVMATHSVGINGRVEISAGDISKGDILKVLSIELSYNFNHATTSKQLHGSEIHRTRQQTVEFIVPGWTKLTRWQFVIDIAGVEYDYDYMLTATNTTEIPRTLNTTARVQLRKRIHFGSTRIRIKHKETGRYMTIVERDRWPAATLGLSNRYHFILNDYGDSGITIKTLNSMYAGYDLLYAWSGGWIYGDYFREFRRCKRLYWFISKEPPLYDGDVVTFMSKGFHHTYLCRNQGSTTDVYSCGGREDEWILEVV